LAGLLASLIGMMNLFARALGGIAGDWAGNRWGLVGRSRLLGLTVCMEGLLMILFSRLTILGPAHGFIPALQIVRLHGVRDYFCDRSADSPTCRRVGFRHCRCGGGNLGAVLAATLF